MRWRAAAIILLALNLLLAGAAAFLLVSWRNPRSTRAQTTVAPSDASTNQPKVVLRRQYFSWREVESPDYPTYIANLRDIGCPEQTIRDIIIADINNLFAKR